MDNKKEEKYNPKLYNKLKEEGCILYEVIVGSQAYGTNVETSDIDKKFVYIMPEDSILGFDYVPQIEVDKDYCGYEIKTFLEFISVNNPSVIEMLYSPEKCVLHIDEAFKKVIENKEKFITKKAKDSFAKYAIKQIKKARGLNKKQNIEQGSVVRKDILDFCYVIQGEKSISWKKWNSELGFEEKFLGITNIPHAKDLYAVFYDRDAFLCFSDSIPENLRENAKVFRKEKGLSMGFGYKGLAKVGGSENAAESNQLRLSSIPKGEVPICNIYFNKDAYTSHCKDYKEYMEWVENRNTARYVDTVKHGQQIDGKNMSHCMRLIRMSKEIGRGEGIKVFREDREELLAIRRGEVDLETLIQTAESEIELIDSIYESSNLPEKVDHHFVNDLLIKIRKEFYGRKNKQ